MLPTYFLGQKDGKYVFANRKADRKKWWDMTAYTTNLGKHQISTDEIYISQNIMNIRPTSIMRLPLSVYKSTKQHKRNFLRVIEICYSQRNTHTWKLPFCIKKTQPHLNQGMWTCFVYHSVKPSKDRQQEHLDYVLVFGL